MDLKTHGPYIYNEKHQKKMLRSQICTYKYGEYKGNK